MRTLLIAAMALLFAGSAFAQSTEGASKTRKDLNPQAVPESHGSGTPSSMGASKTRKEEQMKQQPTSSGASAPGPSSMGASKTRKEEQMKKTP